MTISMEDVRTAERHELRLDRGEVMARPRPHWAMSVRVWLLDQVTDAIVWIAVLAAASGLGLLLSAIVDTVRYGHP